MNARALPPLVITLVLALASAAGAQTNDPLFARWNWAPPELGARPGGMGGAFVAVADSTRAAYTNPAGITLIPVTEVSLSSGEPWLAVGRRLIPGRVAAYVAKTDERRVDLGGQGGGPQATGGFLGASVWEVGLAMGVHPVPRVRLGATAAWSRLDLEGQRLAFDDRGGATPVAAVKGEATRVRLTAGMLITLIGRRGRSLPSLRLGLAYHSGFDWPAQTSLAGGTATVDIRRPTLVTTGLAWRATDRWSFSTQADFIHFSEVVDALHRNVGDAAAAGFSLPDTVQPRLGAEYAAPLWCGCGIVRLRAGIHHRSPGTLRYQGPDPVAAQAFTNRRWHTATALGGSFYTEHFDNALRLDVDARDLFDRRELSFGVAWRF